MTDYYIGNNNSFEFDHVIKKIGLGEVIDNDLTDDELIILVSESLMHEHIHKILYESFDITVCRLFDAVEYHFRTEELFERTVGKSLTHRTWKQTIEADGFNSFLNGYGITNDAFCIASSICNARRELI